MMIKIVQAVLVTGFLCAISNLAMAQGNSWYVAGGLGANFANDADVEQFAVTFTNELDTGALGTVAFGHTFGDWRAEGEFAYMQNDISGLGAFGVTVPASGDVSAAALMANVYYDFNTNSKWRPFVGAGAGYANVGFNDITAGGFAIADDSGGAFAYQLKVGIGYAFTGALDGTLGYRYFGTADVDLVDSVGAPFTADGLQNHAIEVGVRYRF